MNIEMDEHRFNLRRILLTVIGIMAFLITGGFLYFLFMFLISYIKIVIKSHLYPGQFEIIAQFSGLLWFLFFWLAYFGLNHLGLISTSFSDHLEIKTTFCTTRLLPYFFSILIFYSLVAWIPHYLYWPWWMDLSHFAISAHSWDVGIRPYRDLIDFNFPGPTYFMWFLGKTFGWGSPMAANFVDVIVLLGFLWLLFKWGKTFSHSSLPALIAVFLILRYYLSLDYARVMQRDWYVTLLGLSSIMLLQLGHQKWRWWLAGLLMACGLIIRPYAILWVPPILVCLTLDPNFNRQSLKSDFFAFLISGCLFTILLWAPLFLFDMADGFFTEFIRELMYGKYRGSKNQTFQGIIFKQLNTKVIFTATCGITFSLLLARKNSDNRLFLASWFVALVCLFLYMPVIPVRHAYTEIPLEILACVICGITWHELSKHFPNNQLFVLTSLAFWAWFYFPGFPQMCEIRSSATALVHLLRWDDLPDPPPGCRGVLVSDQSPLMRLKWTDYNRTLNFIRGLNEDVRVINFSRTQPFPAYNGPTGRLTLWPCAEGILWLRSVSMELKPDFLNAILRPIPSVIIWSEEKKLYLNDKFPEIEKAIQSEFEPLKEFGLIKVWKRKGFAVLADEKKSMKDFN